MANIECKSCSFTEEANKTFFLKVIGGSFVGGGFWAWVICVAIVTGGVGLLAFSDEITKWLAERHDCPSCGSRKWRLVK